MPTAPASRLPKLRLRKDLRRALHHGAPWLYRDAIAALPDADDGEVVLVLGKDGRPIARGFWSAEGPIAVRVLTTDKSDEVGALVRERLARALAARGKLLASGETTAFRWVHGEGDRLPGLNVDVYGRYASVFFDGSGSRAFYLGLDLPALLLDARASLELDSILERPRRSSGAGAAVALVGELPPEAIDIIEHDLAFGVDLVHGQKGGLFLDQRENRVRVAKHAAGRRVLNLFGYTGGFSLHAARGGAVATTTVDSAKAAIEAAKSNFARNAARLGRSARADEFVVADAFEFLDMAREKGRRYELVISDPPSFAPSERACPAALSAYRRLHALASAVVAPGGILCAASCSSHVGEADFVRTVTDGARDAGRTFVLRESHGAASDHPVRPEFPEGRYLKFAIGLVR